LFNASAAEELNTQSKELKRGIAVFGIEDETESTNSLILSSTKGFSSQKHSIKKHDDTKENFVKQWDDHHTTH